MAVLHDWDLNDVLYALEHYADEAYGSGLGTLIQLIKDNKDKVGNWVNKLPELEAWYARLNAE
jgi:hypothetical protein